MHVSFPYFSSFLNYPALLFFVFSFSASFFLNYIFSFIFSVCLLFYFIFLFHLQFLQIFFLLYLFVTTPVFRFKDAIFLRKKKLYCYICWWWLCNKFFFLSSFYFFVPSFLMHLNTDQTFCSIPLYSRSLESLVYEF